MSNTIAPFVIVDIEATLPQLAYWKCAAALEPGLPSWVGPAWGQLLAMPIEHSTASLPVLLTRDLYVQMMQEECPGSVPINVEHQLTQQALEILRRHGLQPIPIAKPVEPDDYIPF